jgi:hypothetical protein
MDEKFGEKKGGKIIFFEKNMAKKWQKMVKG